MAPERELMDGKTSIHGGTTSRRIRGLILQIQKYGCLSSFRSLSWKVFFPSGTEEFAGTRCVLRERDNAIVALTGGRCRGAPGRRCRRGRKAAPTRMALGDKVRVRADTVDPMRTRVEFALS